MQKALIILLVFAAHALSAADERQALSGHVPAAVANLRPAGRLDGTQRLKLTVGLPSRDEAGLDAFIQDLYDPASPNYHHYLSPEQFTARFGPTEQDYQTVIAFAQASHLTIQHQHANRVVLDVEGAVADIETALHVTMRTYAHPTEGRNFYAPDTEPSLPRNLVVSHIGGLDNFTLPHAKQRHRTADSDTTTFSVHPKLGTAPGGNLWGNDFRDAYIPGVTLTGTGQNVGLLEFDGFYANDVANYETAIGMGTANRPQLIVVPVQGGVTRPTSSGNSEVAGDIEMTVSMAPGLNAVYVFEDPDQNGNGPFDDIYESMLTYTNILQFSCSWGGTVMKDSTSETLFKQMATQGQSFFDASGDDGAFVGTVEYPSDSPSIMQVGGTTLVDGAGPSYPWGSEVVWSWDSGPPGSAASATSSAGGISTYYGIPSWQTNLSLTAAQGSTTMRNFPDISANADNDYLYYSNGKKGGGWGGTSFASPLWAGLTALMNQQAAANHEAPVGFLNPALYALALGPNYAQCFHDITSGNNTWVSSPNLFSAVAGFDLCCGLGTPTGASLINALAPVITLTQPTLAASLVGTNVVIHFLSQSGAIYQLQSTTNLSSISWQAVGGTANGTGAMISTTNSLQISARQFFRLLVTP